MAEERNQNTAAPEQDLSEILKVRRDKLAALRAEGRDPSLTELRVLDTYWSDHCRHTTFGITPRISKTTSTPLRAARSAWRAD